MNIPLPNGQLTSPSVALAMIAFRILIRALAIFAVCRAHVSLPLAFGAAALLIPAETIGRLFGRLLRKVGLIREGRPCCAPDPDDSDDDIPPTITGATS